jgi:hypothetical protein
VNDGEAEIPDLLMSQEMFTIMDEAVTADHRHDEQQKKRRDQITKYNGDIDNTHGDIETLEYRVEHLTNCAT